MGDTGRPSTADSGLLDDLLHHVEHSTSHYEALNVDHTASSAMISAAYERASIMLASTDNERAGEAGVSQLAVERIERASRRLVQAYSVLANPLKRAEYDRFVIVKKTGPLTCPPGAVRDSQPAGRAPHAAPADAQSDWKDSPRHGDSKPLSDPSLLRGASISNAVTRELPSAPEAQARLEPRGAAVHHPQQSAVHATEAADGRIGRPRSAITLLAQVVGYDRETGRWEERAEATGVTAALMNLQLRRRLQQGSVLFLSLPMPAHLRSYAMEAPEYRVYGLVNAVAALPGGLSDITVEFLGEQPPAGYLEKPWATFQSQAWNGAERRAEPREKRTEVVWVGYFATGQGCLRQEAGRTVDISEGGLRAVVKAAPAAFDYVRVSLPERGIESYAVVRNRFSSPDGSETLGLQLVGSPEMAARATARPEVVALPPPRLVEPWPSMYRRHRILVADDDMPLRRVLGKILTSAGYDVDLVEDGKMAIERAAETEPDLVITDGLMPKMHGFLVCKAIKEMRPAAKVIMLTAVYTKNNYKFEARDRYGADELITKPFEVADLLACIERHLGTSPRALAV